MNHHWVINGLIYIGYLGYFNWLKLKKRANDLQQDCSITIHLMLQQARIKETRTNSLRKVHLTIQLSVLIVERIDIDNMLFLAFEKTNALLMTRHAIAVNVKIILKQFAGRKIKRHLLSIDNDESKKKSEVSTARNALCSISTDASNHTSLSLNHHQHNKFLKTWKKQPARPQPFINLNVSVSSED